jgi:hypothetical protein
MRSAIALHGCPVDPEDVTLAAAELFANAVMHGPANGRVLVGYCLWSAGARIVVCDGGGAGTPALAGAVGLPEGGLPEGGRGLRVVDSLAASWGSFRLLGAQVVWSDFGRRLPARAGDAWAWLPPVLATCRLVPPGVATCRLVPPGVATAAALAAAGAW